MTPAVLVSNGFEGTRLIPQARARGRVRVRVRQISRLACVFTIAAISFLEVQVIGRLYITEIILLALFPVLLARRGGSFRKKMLPRRLLLAGVIWLAAQMLTDVVRRSAFEDYARGWAKIVFTLTTLAALSFLLKNDRLRLAVFGAGWAVAGFLRYYLNPNPFAEALPWKFGVGEPITWLLVLFASRLYARKGALRAAGCVAAAGMLNVYFGARSLGGVCLLSAAFLVAKYLQIHSARQPRRPGLGKVLFLGALILGAGLGVVRLYGFLAGEGYLGQTAKELYELQASGNLGVLIGGRSAIVPAAKAIYDSPVLGHGSWAKDPSYANYMVDLSRFGYRPVQFTDTEGYIPSHSYLLGAWVEAGILGAVFWLSILRLTTRTLFALYWRTEPCAPLIAFLGFQLVWDTFFSPFGATSRIAVPYAVAALLSVTGRRASCRLPRRHAGRPTQP